MNILGIITAAIGFFIAVDGIASLTYRGKQYHSVLFDLEREVRAALGFILVFIGIVIFLIG